jgi:hypothetical protein
MAARRPSPSCSRSTSAICSPTVYTGLSEVIGSWNTIAISLPRIARIASCGSGTRSRPRQRISPATMRAGGMARSFITVSAVTLLPQPDSPTTPSVSPRSSAKSTPSTACTIPSSVAKCVFSPRISSRRSGT